jgi:L-fuculose-phosphate aldolase
MPISSQVPSTLAASTPDSDDIRLELCDYSRRIKFNRLTSATGGNISYRVGEDILISPSGFVLDEIAPQDWVKVNLASGEPYPDQFKPSSELWMHLALYRIRSDVNAVMHSHPPYVIACSLVNVSLLPIGSEAPIFLGENVPMVPYVLPASPLLAEAVAKVAADNNVIILQNHGLVTLGKNNHEAYYRTELSEEIAKIQGIAFSMNRGEPQRLSPQQVQEYKDWLFHKKLPEA